MQNENVGNLSKVKLALGAASLFFFVVGLKRSFRRDDGTEIFSDGEPRTDQPEPANTEVTRLRNAS